MSSRLTDQEFAKYLKDFGAMSYKKLADAYKELKQGIDTLDHELKRKREVLDLLRLRVIPCKMDEDEISSIRIKGIGRLGLTLDAHVYVRANDHEAFNAWLVAEGHGGLVQSHVHHATLKAFIKDIAEKASEKGEKHLLPPSLDDLVGYSPFYRASITKT